MKPNELRIGNYVLYENPHSDRVVVQVKAVDFQIGTHNLHPIPLTEEWLVKFGFVYRGIYYHFPNNDIFKLEQYKLKNAYFLKHSTESLDSVRINYVHQLQNLIFALTGEELIIK